MQDKDFKIARKQNKKYIDELKRAKKHQRTWNYDGDIVMTDVSYTYSKGTPFQSKALDKANVTFTKGKVTCIIGTTGSGKSTLIQFTNGLLISETGCTMVGNFPIPAGVKKIIDVKKLRKEVGLVFQFPEYQLFQSTIEKDIAFGPINLGEPKEKVIKKVPSYLELVGLPKSYLTRSPFELSGGQKRRVAIAGILALDGDTLVLDEPTGGLDPQGETDFMNLFERLNKEKHKRIIMVTHNMDHVLQIADEVVVMNQGKLMVKDTPFNIFKDKKLLESMNIEPPKIYNLIHKLADKGMKLDEENIRTIPELVTAIKNFKLQQK